MSKKRHKVPLSEKNVEGQTSKVNKTTQKACEFSVYFGAPIVVLHISLNGYKRITSKNDELDLI
jgi:hypothetical protein